MSTHGLDALKGILMRVCGDLIISSQQQEGYALMRVRQSHSDGFKQAVHGFVAAWNKTHKTSISVGFPKPFSISLRESKKTARSKR